MILRSASVSAVMLGVITVAVLPAAALIGWTVQAALMDENGGAHAARR